MQGHLVPDIQLPSRAANYREPSIEGSGSCSLAQEIHIVWQPATHDVSSARPSLAPFQHGIGSCAHLRSYEIHTLGGASSFSPI